ncbi:MAG: 2-oxoacid:acceptor oxidoreductase family protein [Bacillota bacterium]
MAPLTKIAIAGEGGQGVQSIANIIAEAAYAAGKQALYIPNFGVEQRGGVSIAFVQISDESIGSPKFSKGDIVAALSDRAVQRMQQYIDENTIFVYDSAIKGVESGLPQKAKRILAIPAIQIAQEEYHPRVFNVIVMGAVIGATKVVNLEDIKEALEKKLAYKFEQYPELRELNYKALERGVELVH